MAIRTILAAPALGAVAVAFAGAGTAQDAAPRAGQDARDIARFLDRDVDDLSAGRGWGVARPAERDGYRGPRHGLDLSEAQERDAEQTRRIGAIFAAMETEARALGAEPVAAEVVLRSGDPEGETLTRDLDRTARIEGGVHLAAPLETLPVLPVLRPARVAEDGRVRGHGRVAEGGRSGRAAGGHSEAAH